MPHTGERQGTGLVELVEGMVFTVEPMTTAGLPDCIVAADGWTARIGNGRLSAQLEHTVAATAHGGEVLSVL